MSPGGVPLRGPVLGGDVPLAAGVPVGSPARLLYPPQDGGTPGGLADPVQERLHPHKAVIIHLCPTTAASSGSEGTIEQTKGAAPAFESVTASIIGAIISLQIIWGETEAVRSVLGGCRHYVMHDSIDAATGSLLKAMSVCQA